MKPVHHKQQKTRWQAMASIATLSLLVSKVWGQNVSGSDMLDAMQQSWGQSGGGLVWVLPVFVGVLGGLVIWAALSQWQLRRSDPNKGQEKKVFRDLLVELELTKEERKLLERLARGARLKQPMMCLLSPALLDWARGLWVAEKGGKRLDRDTLERVDDLSLKLFDQLTPSTQRQAQGGGAIHLPNQHVVLLDEDAAKQTGKDEASAKTRAEEMLVSKAEAISLLQDEIAMDHEDRKTHA